MDLARVEELCRAAYAGNAPAVVSALQAGVNPGSIGADGFTPLHKACIAGSIASVSALLAGGADPRQRDAYGDSPLHYAAHLGFDGVARVLLDAGADPNQPGADGRTPLAAAHEQQHHAVVALLIERGAPPLAAHATSTSANPPPTSASDAAAYAAAAARLCDASFAGDLRTVHSLVSNDKVDPNAIDAEGACALHRAAAAGSVPCIDLLVGLGADPNARDHAGCTPLHYAAFCGHTDAVHALLAAGADPSRANRDGLTPLRVAKAEGRTGVVRRLTGVWTRVEGLEFSHGVVLEGYLKARRSGESWGASLFRWKGKYGVLSRPYRALFLWSGTPTAVEGAVLKLRTDNIEAVLHDAKAGSKKFTIRPVRGEPLELAASSAEDASLWVAALRSLLVALAEEDSKASLVRQLLASDAGSRKAGQEGVAGAAAVAAAAAAASSVSAREEEKDRSDEEGDGEAGSSSGGKKSKKEKKDKKEKKEKKDKKEKKEKAAASAVGAFYAGQDDRALAEARAADGAGVAGGAAALVVKPPMSELTAALLLQRVWRGHKARRLVKGWVRVVDETDGDIYFFHTLTGVSSWYPPGEDPDLDTRQLAQAAQQGAQGQAYAQPGADGAAAVAGAE